MLLIVSPNFAIDRILAVDELRVGEVQRSRSVVTQPGGKGSNAARVFRQLGGDVALIGFVGRRNPASVRDPLLAMGIQVEAIEAYDGESRVCTIILDGRSNTHPTVINEETPIVDADAIGELQTRFDRLLENANMVFVTGSLSRGLPADFYTGIIGSASARGVTAAIDATGAVMSHGLAAKPEVAKANLQEFTEVLGPLGHGAQDIVNSIRKQGDEIPPQLIVTLGEDGAILISGDQTWHASPPRISHMNPIGAGDAFAAGYLMALMDGMSRKEALRFATAVSASDANTREPGFILPEEIPSLVASTQVKPL